MTTGERIKLRRKQLDMSAEKLAGKLGLSPATIYRYEKGDIEKVPGTILAPLSEALSTTPAYLMGWDDQAALDVRGDEKQLQTFIKLFSALSPGDRLSIISEMIEMQDNQKAGADQE